MSYRVLLIDDETWALVYLKKIFQWEKRGFKVVAEAQDTRTALELAAAERPDVIMTDIRMPGFTGLELMQECREKGIVSEFVIVSGFAEFAYAQEAVRLGAFEYVLKPVGAEQADQLLLRLSARLSKSEQGVAETVKSEAETLPDDANGHFEELLGYMKDHLQEKLQLKELARRFYLNPNYCCHLFNKYMGKSFSEYLTELRMNEATNIMKNKQLTIEEIGRQAGYPDYFYFNKVFKKYYGVTPKEYRKEGSFR